MSLFRQISILLSVIFILLFVLILTISFNQIKDSAQKSLYENVQNSVSNISLSITNAKFDESTIKTVLNASFDNGNYEKILFKNLEEKIVYKRIKKEDTDENVPTWFLNFVSIDEIFSSSTVSQGWSILGTLEVYANRDTLYLQLYKIFVSLSFTLVAIFIFVLLIVSFFFKTILKPLIMIKEQSDCAMNNNFIFQEKIPFTLEFKSLTISINKMIEKIQNMFHQANEILKRNKELLYIDQLTKLYNRNYFIFKISEYLDENSTNNSGFIITVVLNKIDLLNKKIGYESVDEVIKCVTNFLNQITMNNNSSFSARTKAGEFIIVLPRENKDRVIKWAEELSINLSEIMKKNYNKSDIKFSIGICSYNNLDTNSKFLSKIDFTILNSKINNTNKEYYLNEKDISTSKKDFRQIINFANKNDSFNLLFRKIVELNTNKTIYNTISFEIKTEDKNYAYGEFIALVIELDLLEEVYLKIIKKVLDLKLSDEIVTIQIPNRFIENMPFEKLNKMFSSTNNFKNIIFELEEESFFKNYFNCIVFVNLLKDYKFDLAIFNFLGISQDYNYLKLIKPKYIKVNKEILESENLYALNMIKNSLNIELIATSVNLEEDIKSLQDKNITLISGEVTEKLKDKN